MNIGTKTEYIIEGYFEPKKRWESFGDQKTLEQGYKTIAWLRKNSSKWQNYTKYRLISQTTRRVGMA